MALVANPLPHDTLTVGKIVAYFDPTPDMAGLNYGQIVDVVWGVSGTNAPVTVTVRPLGAEDDSTDVTGAGNFFRVVDNFIPPPAKRPNV